MRKLLSVCLLLPCCLTGCVGAAHQAKMNYIHATTALNDCLLANPGNQAACTAQQQVQQNDLALYTNLSN